MKYDFDRIIDRSGSGDLKHEALLPRWGRNDLLPLWVADMDWETPPFITEALRQRLDHPIFGYTVEPADLWPSIIDWVATHHAWEVQREWLSFIPGIVRGIGIAINVFCEKEDAVIIQPPVYHPFRLTTEGNGRQLLQNPLIETQDGSYRMDFDNLQTIVEEYNARGRGKVRLLILSNPHNPAGICWNHQTLVLLAAFCKSHGIIVISDEIHCDLALWNHRHIPFATVSPEAAECSITFMAPTKTFNMAGLTSSFSIVPHESIRRRFYGWLQANELNEPTLFAPIATIAAYRKGEEWRRQMLRYTEGNIEFLIDYCRQHIPQIKPVKPQASFLVWLDCRGLKLNHDQLLHLFVERAHLALNDGEIFYGGEAYNLAYTGSQGHGFMRINVGTPRAILRQALEQLRKAVQE
ncbi:MAG: MalY/PatB family protein [Prevotella sp.]